MLNITTIINTFKSENNNIARIKTQHQQIIATIREKALEVKLMIKNLIVANHAFSTVATFKQDQFICLNQFYHNTIFVTPFY